MMTECWLIVGGSGMLGHALCEDLLHRGKAVSATAHGNALDLPKASLQTVDLARPFDARRMIGECEADVVVYAAGLTNVDKCEADEDLAFRLHAAAAADIAAATVSTGTQFIYISTDHLWDGHRQMMTENDPVAPINAYARTKAAGEIAVRDANPGSLVLRTNFFGQGRPWRLSLSDWMLDRLRSGNTVNAFADSFFTPIGIPILVQSIVEAAEAKLSHVYHCCGSERVSKYAFALALARQYGFPQELIHCGQLADAGLTAPRPADMSLSTEKISRALGRKQPTLAESLHSLSSVSSRITLPRAE